jgi:hypothetical protein
MPPKRKPYFCDAIGGRECTFPETGPEMSSTLQSLVSTASTFPEWELDNDGEPALPVRLTVLEYVQDRVVHIGFACAGIDGVLSIRPDLETGFVLVKAEVAGVTVLKAYMDRPYEEYGLYPPDDNTAQADEGPGRMSKNRWWVSLSADAWPALRPLTASDLFNARVPDRC